MFDYVNNPEERRLMILRGIGKDLTSLQIAEEMGIRKWVVIRDLRTMRFNRDPELKQAYFDQNVRDLTSRHAVSNMIVDKFKLMTGMSFQEKNFENMVTYYRPELIKVLESDNEHTAIGCLPRSVQKVLARYEITVGLRNNHKVSSKARDFLPLPKFGD
jgi:hypothetical protein